MFRQQSFFRPRSVCSRLCPRSPDWSEAEIRGWFPHFRFAPMRATANLPLRLADLSRAIISDAANDAIKIWARRPRGA
jgi:hypothetical protein